MHESVANEFLVFSLGAEEYAIGIQSVRELRGYETVTRIANAADFVKGVINLRGVIVPIFDLRIKFGLGAPTYDATTVVIIINVGDCVAGMVVDGVSDVLTLAPDEIKPAPSVQSAAINAEYLLGLGTLGERMLILVDIECLMGSEYLGGLQALAA